MATATVIPSSKNSRKRKCFVEDVYPVCVDKMVANPLLVSFRTQKPRNTVMTGYVTKEPVSKRDRPGLKYRSVLTITAADGEQEEEQCFIGHSARSNSDGTDGETTMLGVLDKTTGKLNLYELEQYSVKRQLDSEAHARLHSAADREQESAAVLFGTKQNLKRHRAMQQYKERTSVKVLTAVQSAFEVVAATQRDPQQKEVTAADYDYIAPLINEAAATAQDVYHMSSVVTDSILEHFFDSAKALLDGSMPACDTVSSLFLHCVASARLEQQVDVRLRHTCAALFVERLVRVVCGTRILDDVLPKPVFEYLCYKYNVRKPKMVVQDVINKDEALCHLLVLVQLINRCCTPIDVILNSVTVVRSRLMKFVRILRMEHSAKNIVLRFPLPILTQIDGKKRSLKKKI